MRGREGRGGDSSPRIPHPHSGVSNSRSNMFFLFPIAPFLPPRLPPPTTPLPHLSTPTLHQHSSHCYSCIGDVKSSPLLSREARPLERQPNERMPRRSFPPSSSSSTVVPFEPPLLLSSADTTPESSALSPLPPSPQYSPPSPLSPSSGSIGGVAGLNPTAVFDQTPFIIGKTVVSNTRLVRKYIVVTCAGVLSTPIRVSPGAVIPTMVALAGVIDPEVLTSKSSIAYVGVSDVPSPILHPPTRVSRGAVIHTSPGGVINAGFNATPSTGGQSKVDVGNTLLLGFLVFMLFVLPLWTLSLWALRKMCGTRELRGWARSWRRTRLPVRRVPRHRRPVFRTIGGYWALNLLLLGGEVGKHLLFVGAAPKGTLTDAEFKAASWGTFSNSKRR